MGYVSDLNTELLRLSEKDGFTLRDACQGVAITGSIGSGKTSGSGAALAGAYLRAGMGGLVMVAKPEEAELWRAYVAKHGRKNSLIELSPRSGGFNFLSYELARQGPAGVNAVVECLMRVLEAAANASPTPGRQGDSFWGETTRQVLRNTVPILMAAKGTVTIPDIISFVRSAPNSAAQMSDLSWQQSSFLCQSFMAAEGHIPDAVGEQLVNYWRQEWAGLDPKTRGNIGISLTTTLDRFNHGWMRSTFCGETTLVPELCFHGAIILLDMPALTLNEDGIIAQQIFKYMWQRAVLARNGLDKKHGDRPVFLWADEAQYFINSYDAEFLSTSRGSKACTVFLSQSLPTYYAKMSGDNVVHRVDSLLGNFATKVFHSSGCPVTNEWAARAIGRVIHRRASFGQNQGVNTSWGNNRGMNIGDSWNSSSGSSHGRSGGNGQFSSNWSYNQSSGTGYSEGLNRGANQGGGQSHGTNQGWSEQVDYLIEPGEFARILKTGGPANANTVTGVWFQSGRTFRQNERNCLITAFAQ